MNASLQFFYWDLTPFSILVQLFHGNSSLIRDLWVKQTSSWLGNMPCQRALPRDCCAATGDRTRHVRRNGVVWQLRTAKTYGTRTFTASTVLWENQPQPFPAYNKSAAKL